MHDYQVRASDYVFENTHGALWLSMGLGKTISALTAIRDLIYTFQVDRVLVIAPLRVAKHVWPNEIQSWSHTSSLSFQILAGESKAKREFLVHRKADIHLINREMVGWLVTHLIGEPRKADSGRWPYDMIVIDESSSFKNPSTKRFKALRRVWAATNRVVELTGTPISNGYLEIWPQFYLLDGGERLGRTITSYRDRYFVKKDFRGFSEYSPRAGAVEDIQERISDMILRMRAEDYLELPDVVSNNIDVEFTPALREQYSRFEREFLVKLEEMDSEILALSAAALSQKLLQFVNGAIYDSEKTPHPVHELKLDALESVIEENPDENLLVAYNFVSDKDRILARFPQAVDIKTEGAIDAWNRREVKMLFCHPASAGHGLNLQFGGKTVVWFGMNWSLELYQQFNGRLTSGLRLTKPSFIHHIVVRDSIDEVVLTAVKDKNTTQQNLLDAVREQARIHTDER